MAWLTAYFRKKHLYRKLPRKPPSNYTACVLDATQRLKCEPAVRCCAILRKLCEIFGTRAGWPMVRFTTIQRRFPKSVIGSWCRVGKLDPLDWEI